MDTIFWKIHNLIREIKRYDMHARDSLSKKDYPTICSDANNLLEDLEGNEILNKRILKNEEDDFKHFIGSLKILSSQEKMKNYDGDIIRAAYHESRTHASGFLNVLFEEMYRHS